MLMATESDMSLLSVIMVFPDDLALALHLLMSKMLGLEICALRCCARVFCASENCLMVRVLK